MKKTVVTLLLVLPFLLIYFVSFTGKILSEYKHIYVERIAVVNDKGVEYQEGDYIKLDLNEVYDLKIKVYPELASDKAVIISNSNKNICDVDATTYKVTTKKYGISKLIITSRDRHFVQFTINIYVTQDDITDFTLTKDVIDLTVGRSEQIDVNFTPDTALPENRELTYTVADTTVARVSATGLVTGLKFGTTTITVASKHKPEISKTLTVNVTLEFGKGLHFANTNAGKVYTVNTAEFDLKTITIINDINITINDVYYSVNNVATGVTSNDYDDRNISQGIIKFNAECKAIIISAEAYEIIGDEVIPYYAYITIWYDAE